VLKVPRRAATAQERGERRRRMRAKLGEAAAKLKRRGEGADDGLDDGTGDDSPGAP
jgi:uncharacterized protein